MKRIAIALAVSLAVSGAALAQEKTIKIAGFGAKTGAVRSFGVNSEAALLAAAHACFLQRRCEARRAFMELAVGEARIAMNYCDALGVDLGGAR